MIENGKEKREIVRQMERGEMREEGKKREGKERDLMLIEKIVREIEERKKFQIED